VAVYVALNIDILRSGEGLCGEVAPGGTQPDGINYAGRLTKDNRRREFLCGGMDCSSFRVDEATLSSVAKTRFMIIVPKSLLRFANSGRRNREHGRQEKISARELSPNRKRARLIAEVTDAMTAEEGKTAPDVAGIPWISESGTRPTPQRSRRSVPARMVL